MLNGLINGNVLSCFCRLNSWQVNGIEALSPEY